MESVSPVFGEDEVQFERVIALDQPEYKPVIILPIDLHIQEADGVTVKPSYGAAVRFRLSDEERAKVAEGADLILTELVFGQPFTPIHLELCARDERPEF